MKAKPKLLTAPGIEKLRPGKDRREISDAGSPSLRLLIEVSGRKTWIMRFRRPDGRVAKLTLGPVDLSGRESDDTPQIGTPLTLTAARWLAAEVHRQRARGRDVIADRHAEKVKQKITAEGRQANSFGSAARVYIDDYCRQNQRSWRDTARALGLVYTDDNEPTIMKGSLVWRWRDRPVVDFQPTDLDAVVDEARRTGIPGWQTRAKGTSNARGRLLGTVLSGFFSWLSRPPYSVKPNPATDLYMPDAGKARERTLRDSEIRWVWTACDQIGTYGKLCQLLLLTGARRDEWAEATRSEVVNDTVTVDGKKISGTFLSLPSERTKNKRPHVVPLSPLALSIMDSVPVIAGKRGYIFTSNGRVPSKNWTLNKRRLDAAMLAAARKDDPAVTIPPWTLHDLRRTASTGMHKIGVAPHVVEAAINHISGSRGGVAGTYNRYQYLVERKAAFDRWCSHVESVVTGKASDNVVTLRA